METNTKLGQEQAFPLDYTGNSDREVGMSQRFYAACQIAPHLISSFMSDKERAKNINDLAKENSSSYQAIIIKMVYQIVDELLKQENE